MSDDIVNRLRNEITYDGPNDVVQKHLLVRAADEIERLRLVISCLQADVRMAEIANESLSIRPQMELSRLRSLIVNALDVYDNFDNSQDSHQRWIVASEYLREAVGR